MRTIGCEEGTAEVGPKGTLLPGDGGVPTKTLSRENGSRSSPGWWPILSGSLSDISWELQRLSPGRYQPLQKCPNPSCALLATYQVKGARGNMGPAE